MRKMGYCKIGAKVQKKAQKQTPRKQIVSERRKYISVAMALKFVQGTHCK
jgi:hypothetical protein